MPFRSPIPSNRCRHRQTIARRSRTEGCSARDRWAAHAAPTAGARARTQAAAGEASHCFDARTSQDRSVESDPRRACILSLTSAHESAAAAARPRATHDHRRRPRVPARPWSSASLLAAAAAACVAARRSRILPVELHPELGDTRSNDGRGFLERRPRAPVGVHRGVCVSALNMSANSPTFRARQTESVSRP